MLATFVVWLGNDPAAFERVTGLLRRRGFEIRSLTAGDTDTNQERRMTLQIETDESGAVRLQALLDKLANVLRVENVFAPSCLLRELAIVKVAATCDERAEIIQITSVFRARVIHVCRGSVIIEATGTEAKINALIEALASYGIIDMARTGPLAMVRGMRGSEATHSAVAASVGRDCYSPSVAASKE